MNKTTGGILAVVAVAVIAVGAWIALNSGGESPTPDKPAAVQAAPAQPDKPEAPPAPEEPATLAQPPAPEQTPAPVVEDPAPAPAAIRSIADGRIQAEDFDQGGEGTGYHDTTSGNMYGQYRQEGPDIETFEPGSFSIGGVAPGEWLAYTLSVPADGEYDIDFHTATPRAGNQIHIFVNKAWSGSNNTVPATSGWGDFQTFTAPKSLKLTAGDHTFRLHFPQGFINLDWFEFHKLNTNWPAGGVAAIRTVWDLTNTPAEGTTVTLKGQSPGNEGRWTAMGVTDANGELKLEFPDFAKTTQVQARHPYSRIKSLDGVALPPAQTLVIRLERETTLFGTAMFAGTGQPAGGATIEALGSGQKATTNADGTWEIIGLEAKSIRLIASKDDLVSYKDASEIPTINITSGAPNGPHNLILKKGPMMTGRVTDEETGQPVAEAKLSARLMSADFVKIHEAKSGADGRYKIPGLWGNRYSMQVESEEYVPANMIIAQSSDLQVERDFALEPGATVHVTVKDTNGQPIQGAQFYVIKNNNHWDSDETSTDEMGKAALKQISRKNLPQVVARKTDYTQSERQTPAFEDGSRETNLEFILAAAEKQDDDGAPKVFVGRVTDKEGQPISYAKIYWGQRWSLRNNAETTETDSDGRYRLETKKPVYDYNMLAVTAEDYAPAWHSGAKPGPEDAPAEFNFTLEDAHWLNVLVVDEQKVPIPGANVSIQAQTQDQYGMLDIPGLGGGNQQTDDQGRLRLEGLPGPTVMLGAGKSGFTTRPNQSTGVDKDETIELKPAGIILGRLLDKDTKTPISEFNVKIEGSYLDYERTRQGESISNAEGRFKLADLSLDNQFTLTFTADDYPPGIESKVLSQREDQANERTFYITRGEGLTIELVAAGNPDQLVTGAQVVAALRNPTNQGSYRHIQWGEMAQNQWMWKSVETKATNEIGRVTFDEGSEKYYLFIMAKGWSRVSIEPSMRRGYVTDESGLLRIPLSPESAIEGNFTLKGQPQEGQHINLSRSGNNLYESFGTKQTAAGGAFEFDSLAAGEYTLGVTKMVSNYGYNSMSKKIQLGVSERKNVVLGEDLGPFTLSGRVTRDGKPLSRSHINANNQFGWEYFSLGGMSGDDGRYVVEGLKPGRYNINVSWNDNTGGYLNKSEKITIEGDTELDFEFGGAFKVIAKLKYPEAMPVEVRSRFRNAQLNFVGNWSQLQQEGLEGHKYVTLTGDQLEMSGRFKGKYNLSLNYNSTDGGQSVSIPLPGSPFEIDTTEHDHDLGEIEVPMPGGVKFELVFERPSNRDYFRQVTMSTTSTGWHQAPNTEGISYHVSQSIGDNPMTLPGRFKGEYRMTVSLDGNTHMGGVNLPDTFTIADPNIETDLGQIVVPAVYEVRGRLMLNEENRAMYSKVALRRGEIDGPSESNTDGLSRSGLSDVGPDGSFVITGRFRGKYVMALGADQNIAYGQGFSLPNNFDLDNLNSDIDLGDIEIAGTGMVKIVLNHTDPTKSPDMMVAFNMDDSTFRNQFDIENTPEQEIGPLPEGEVTLRFISPGFRLDPPAATVMVDAETVPVITINTSPEGMLMGMANDPANPGTIFKSGIVSLEGAGISRTISTIQGTLNSFVELWAGTEDTAVNAEGMLIFCFRDLPEGEYTVRIEVEDYKPAEDKKQVTPGEQEFGEMNFTLEKLDAAEPEE